MKIQINIHNQTKLDVPKEYEKLFQQCAETVFADSENLRDRANIVEEEEIQRLNRDYRKVDKVTDVLSFFLNDEDMAEQDGYIYLGDVILCAKQAQRQAKDYGHSLQREMMYLFVHALLHLKGYDHMQEAEKAQMQRRKSHEVYRIGKNLNR